jgi:signal transduction histidine kinase/ActR/RegA family two-component response regulator
MSEQQRHETAESGGTGYLPRDLFIALALIIFPLLAAIGLQVYEAARAPAELERDRGWIAHTLAVIDTVERLKSTAQNAERQQRGYLITGTPAYREAYQSLANKCRALLAVFKQQTADNPEQQRRLPVLSLALEEWLADRQATVDAYEQQGPAAARRLVSTRAGVDTLRHVDGILEEAISTERALLRQREANAEQGRNRIRDTALLAVAIDVLLLGLGIVLTLTAFRRARRVADQQRITERHLNEQLLQAQAALAQTQKMEALGQLTGGVAHDFNNLLHVINNAVAVLQRMLKHEDPQVTHYLAMVRRNVDRAVGTTSRLLAFARRQPLAPRPTDINKVVSGMTELLRSTLGEGVAIELVAASGLWPVAIDRNQFENAVVNLAINARDAMSMNGKLTIETSNAFLDESYARLHSEVTPGQYAMIAVSDTGVGMSQEVARQAFEPFFTTKDAGQGTGLGLSQVFGFVKQSGGHVAIYSEPGQGTTVKMYFPRLLGARAQEPTQKPQAVAAGSGESILVVEDNEDVLSFTERLLRDLGYRVATAADAHQAMKVLEELKGVDLLFTDVGLPGGTSGRALADEARSRWPTMKVLYTTGYARNSIIHHGRLDAGVELITKPFTQSALAEKVRRVLGKGPKNSDRSAVDAPGDSPA